MGKGYVQTRENGTTRDRWQGNNSKVIRHMRKNTAQHKRTKQNKIKRHDKGVMRCTGMWLKNITFTPATLNSKLRDLTQNYDIPRKKKSNVTKNVQNQT